MTIRGINLPPPALRELEDGTFDTLTMDESGILLSLLLSVVYLSDSKIMLVS